MDLKGAYGLITYVPTETYLFIGVFVFIFGTMLGSFYSLIKHRIKNKKKGIIGGRSECIHCGHKLGFFDLFPILSYLFLRGRCRYCKRKIGAHYLLYEMIGGIVAIIIYIFLCFNTNVIHQLSVNLGIHGLKVDEKLKEIDIKGVYESQEGIGIKKREDTKVSEPLRTPSITIEENKIEEL